MTMKINVADGSVEFVLGTVTPTTDKAAFLTSPLGREARIVVENGPYVTFSVDLESGVGATLSFKNEHLQDLSWSLKMSAFEEEGWSEESEMKRKKLHDDWLHDALGEPPYRYKWGEVVSEYDAKGVSSAIIVVYDR
jgi:hypothetical protein